MPNHTHLGTAEGCIWRIAIMAATVATAHIRLAAHLCKMSEIENEALLFAHGGRVGTVMYSRTLKRWYSLKSGLSVTFISVFPCFPLFIIE